MWFTDPNKLTMPAQRDVLLGRPEPIPTAAVHFVNGSRLAPPWPAGSEIADFGLGCFWGAERLFWQTPGVLTTVVGYAAGATPNATYAEVCSGRTGHAEVVRVVFDPAIVSYEELLRVFWENHDPTQGMRQGNDVGTQYRSVILTHSDAQARAAAASRDAYARELAAAGYGPITTEIVPAEDDRGEVPPKGAFYPAEEYHQQYLAKNPDGYCGLAGTGVSCPVGLGVDAAAD